MRCDRQNGRVSCGGLTAAVRNSVTDLKGEPLMNLFSLQVKRDRIFMLAYKQGTGMRLFKDCLVFVFSAYIIW